MQVQHTSLSYTYYSTSAVCLVRKQNQGHKTVYSGQFQQCIAQVQYSALTSQQQYHRWQLSFCQKPDIPWLTYLNRTL